MPLILLKEKLEKLGCQIEVEAGSLTVSFEDKVSKVPVDDEWISEIKSFTRSNQFEFDLDSKKLIGPRSVEVLLSWLSPDFYSPGNHTFKSANKRLVEISRCSRRFCLHFFASEEYEKYFNDIVVRRLRHGRLRKLDDLFWAPTSIKFSIPRKTDRSRLIAEALPTLEACLFKLAVERGECLHFTTKRKPRLRPIYEEPENEILSIPVASYDSNMINYYKVAISSQFPSQEFLAFYHILEYNFLNVSDEVLQGQLKAHIHSTSFSGNDDQLSKIISIVKKHTDRSDEIEMLVRVLRKYIDEDELIEHIIKVEEQANEKLYTKSRDVFGENFVVSAKKDHAISNVGKLLKHIRNALVHSSDRYNREDCHIPLTESEDIIQDYIPLIRFLAEKVIYARSS